MRHVKIAVAVAAALLGAAGFAAADRPAEGRPFVGASYGQTSANYGASGRAERMMSDFDFDDVIRHSDTWGVRAGYDQGDSRYYVSYGNVSDDRNGIIKFRQQTATVSYDRMLPVTATTRLFGGVSAGTTYVAQVSKGYASDRDWGLHAGLQAGVLQQLTDNAELEFGYRYAKHDGVDVDFARNRDGLRTGTARLNSTGEAYLGLNWRL